MKIDQFFLKMSLSVYLVKERTYNYLFFIYKDWINKTFKIAFEKELKNQKIEFTYERLKKGEIINTYFVQKKDTQKVFDILKNYLILSKICLNFRLVEKN